MNILFKIKLYHGPKFITKFKPRIYLIFSKTCVTRCDKEKTDEIYLQHIDLYIEGTNVRQSIHKLAERIYIS